MNIYLEFIDDKSSKFWSVETDGNLMTVTYGRIGTAGQSDTKTMPSADAAEKEATKQAAGKMKKGYQQKEASDVPATPKASPGKAPEVLKVPKAEVKAAPTTDVADDGKIKEWHGDEFWDACFWDADTYQDLDKPCEASATQPEPKKKTVAKEDDFDADSLQEEFEEACEDSDYEDAKKALDKLRPVLAKADMDAMLAAGMVKAHGRIRRVEPEHFDLIEMLLAEGASLPTPGERCNVRVAAVTKQFLKANGTKSYREVVDEYFTELYDRIAEHAVKLLKVAVEKIAAGKYQEGCITNGRLSHDSFGFRFDASYNTSEIRVFGSGKSTKLESREPDGTGDIDSDITRNYYAKSLQPLIEKLLAESLFDTITTTGRIAFSTEYGGVFLHQILDPATYEQVRVASESTIAYFETSENWEDDEDTLMPAIIAHLTNGFDPDGERCLHILRKYLYCGESDTETAAYHTIEEAKKIVNNPAYLYEEAMHDYREFSWGWFEKNMAELVEKYDYEPAKQRLAEWAIEEPLLDLKEDEEEAGDDEDDKPHWTYTDEDLIRETGTMIARANPTGRIDVRFKVEGLQGYHDVLDYLNNLMTKGYSRKNDGYEMGVYFLAKPVMPKLSGDAPKVPELALFYKMAMYEELHAKIRTFVTTTVQEYDHYHNLDGEWSTGAGTFAAIGAFMQDVRFMDLALQMAAETDGEHEEISAQVAVDVKKKHGVTPQTVAAIYELGASRDTNHFCACKELYTVAENLEAFMEHYITNFNRNSKYKLVRYIEEVSSSNTKSLLKKLKEYFDGGQDSHVKGVYADFYNLVLEVMGEKDGTDYGNMLSAAPAVTNMPVEIEHFEESLAVIITASEASKRAGKRVAELSSTEGRAAFIFRNSAITNPFIYDHVRENREAIGKLSKDVCMTYTCYSADNFELVSGNKWAFDLAGAACQHGMVLIDGKNKPVVLYGVLNYANIVRKFGKKSTTDLTLIEQLRVENIVMESPKGTPNPLGLTEANDFLGKADQALYLDNYSCTLVNLDKVTKDNPQYPASLLIRAELMRKRKDRQALKQIYAELLTLLPEYAEYWSRSENKCLS